MMDTGPNLLVGIWGNASSRPSESPKIQLKFCIYKERKRNFEARGMNAVYTSSLMSAMIYDMLGSKLC